ncbi:MAG: non-canonical purine NTP pyrophosphatase [bacterium]|nr:MAG: non-canonical purine NTP pyrophosphatase [bacterium]
MKIVLATRDADQLRIMRNVMKRTGVELVLLEELDGEPPEIPRDGTTFAQNAMLKASALARWANLPVLAEDSGLEVRALGGAPGVDSPVFAGEDGEANADVLLERMSAVPGNERHAQYTCAVCLSAPDGRHWEAEGHAEGMITTQKKGYGGSGYDPVFFFPAAGMTFAEMPPMIRSTVSHLLRALEELERRLPAIVRDLEKTGF